ncbi:MAG: hypothetical protein H6560_07550 [Lewinellaceae bacterium]|nr:hypothetical protein [Lewinellaceae bacterium]
MKSVIITLAIGMASLNLANAQNTTVPAEAPNDPKEGATKFLLAGKAQLSWTNTKMEGSPSSNTFFPDAFMLLPLVKLNDKFFLDAQVEVDVDPSPGGSTAIDLVEMIAYYRLLPEVSVFFGNFSPKYGLYSGVLDDFTNRFCTDPIGLARGPSTQTGIGLQGGIQAGYSKLNYQIYLSSGPQLTVDNTPPGNDNLTGQLTYDNYTDNNNNKAIGGSIGFLPFSNSSLQLDLSGQYAAKTGDAGTDFENIGSFSWAADLNYYHVFNPITLRVLAEYNYTTTDNFDYVFTDSISTKALPGFKNEFSGWYAGVTVRPTGAQSGFLSNLELAGRIGAYAPPKYKNASLTDAPWGENAETQTTACLTYWFTWKTPLNFVYDVLKQTDGLTVKTVQARLIYFF